MPDTSLDPDPLLASALLTVDIEDEADFKALILAGSKYETAPGTQDIEFYPGSTYRFAGLPEDERERNLLVGLMARRIGYSLANPRPEYESRL